MQHLGELVDMLQNRTVNLVTAKKVLEEYVGNPSVTPRQVNTSRLVVIVIVYNYI